MLYIGMNRAGGPGWLDSVGMRCPVDKWQAGLLVCLTNLAKLVHFTILGPFGSVARVGLVGLEKLCVCVCVSVCVCVCVCQASGRVSDVLIKVG